MELPGAGLLVLPGWARGKDMRTFLHRMLSSPLLGVWLCGSSPPTPCTLSSITCDTRGGIWKASGGGCYLASSGSSAHRADWGIWAWWGISKEDAPLTAGDRCVRGHLAMPRFWSTVPEWRQDPQNAAE